MPIILFLFACTAARCLAQSVPATPDHPFYTGVSRAFSHGVGDVLITSLERLHRIVLGVDLQLTHIHASANHSACFDDAKPDVATLATCVEDEILACITDVIVNVEIAVAGVARQTEDVVDVMQATVATLTVCLERRRLEAASCLVEAVADAEGGMEDAGAALRDAVVSAEEVLARAPQDMSECAMLALQVARVDAQQIVSGVAQCVADHWEHSGESAGVQPPSEDLTEVVQHSTEGVQPPSEELSHVVQHSTEELTEGVQPPSEELSHVVQHSTEELTEGVQPPSEDLTQVVQHSTEGVQPPSEELSHVVQHSTEELTEGVQPPSEELSHVVQHSTELTEGVQLSTEELTSQPTAERIESSD